MRTKHLVVILVLLALVLPASPAHAGGIVSICDEAHLLAALAGGGTVTFACSGTITLTATITIAADTTIDGSGQAVTISGNNAVRVFYVNSGVTLNLSELTITSGSVSDYGGGVFNNGGTLIVSNSNFSDNSSSGGYDGGGIMNVGMLTVSNSSFGSNSAFGNGGGILNETGTVTVSNSAFSGNSAGPWGGGIYNVQGTLTVSNSSFSGNSASRGGGIATYEGILTVSYSTFSGNSTSYSGGGIRSDSTTVTVSNSTFSDNSANTYGGSIFNAGPTTVSNSTFSGNSGTTGGGGIWNAVDTITLSNSTFSGNSSGVANSSGTVTLKNTIVANSLVGSNCAGTMTDGGGNLSYPDATCPGINADPVLGPLQNNGGPTETMALGAGSAALDAGNDAICAAAPVNNRDQRGIVRPQGLHCDIGAVEQYCPSFVPPATVGVEDILAIAARWGWTNSTPGWDHVYDLNGDNKIDIVDIMLVTRTWGATCS